MMWMCYFIFLLLERIKMEKVDCSCKKNYNFRLRWNLYPVRLLQTLKPTVFVKQYMLNKTDII